MFDIEELLSDLIERIRNGEPTAFEEFGSSLGTLFAFFLLGSGVGLHGAEAVKWVAKWTVTVAASAYAATKPYTEWLEHQLEDLVHRDFFHDAARMQNRIMCEMPPFPAGVQAHAVLRPRQRVSGDIILALPSDHEAWFAVGDVTSHGTAAAVFAALVLRVLQMARTDPEVEAADQPLAAAARKVNGEILRNKDGNISLPVIFARLIPQNAIVEILNCGSPAKPLLVRDRAVVAIDEGSLALGYFPNPELPIWRHTWERGDLLILPTDGLVEQTDAHGHMYSNQRLAQSLETIPSQEPRAVADHIFDVLDQFAAGSEQSDDQSLLVIRLRG